MLNELLSGLVGAIIGVVGTFFTLRFNYRELFAKTVSSNRMEWINNFREEIATVIAALKCNDDSLNEQSKDETMLFQAEKARARLLTRINLDTSKNGNEYNQVFSEILSSIDFGKPCPKAKEKADVLMDLSRKILEHEWKRVKKEAGGKEK